MRYYLNMIKRKKTEQTLKEKTKEIIILDRTTKNFYRKYYE